MRRVLILICLLVSIVSNAQVKYSIHRCEGKVWTYDANSNSWSRASSGDVLDLKTVIDVPAKDGVQIFESTSNRIYSNTKAGKQTVASLIEKSEKNATSTFANLNRQIIKNVTKAGQGKTYSTYGMTTRGLSEGVTLVDSLYYAIYMNFQEEGDDQCGVRLNKITNLDESISFLIDNHENRTLYISLLYGNSSSLSLCLDETLFREGAFALPGNSILDLSSFKFVEPRDGNNYYLVVSEKKFSLLPIKNVLRYMRKPKFTADKGLITVMPTE